MKKGHQHYAMMPSARPAANPGNHYRSFIPGTPGNPACLDGRDDLK
jgi:hypothetical protein